MMRRLLLIVLFGLVSQLVLADDDFPEVKYRGLIDLRAIGTDTTTSWMDGGLGKLRYGGDNAGNGRTLGRLAEAALVITPRFNWDYTGRLVLKYDPEQKNTVDVLEGFLAYRPITTSAYRLKSRVGLFFPPVSLENDGIAWTSPYSITPSAINSWIGEEVRTLGGEFTLIKLAVDDRYSLTGAVYKANDPTGSLLAYRGWAMHDRKVSLNDRVPLAPITPFQPGNAFEDQTPWVAPFEELDDRWGYYVAADWKHLDMSELRVLYYDNRADPSVFDGGQYAWHTRFTSIGLKFELENRLDILTQFITGNTLMGVVGNANPIDNDFSAFYALVSKRLGAHRLTLRYDDFEVDDVDSKAPVLLVPYDLNDEKGDAWTFAYSYRIKRNQLVIMEAIRAASQRPARVQISSESDIREVLLQVSYRLFL